MTRSFSVSVSGTLPRLPVRAALSSSRLSGFNKGDNVTDLPKLVGHARGHGWAHPQLRMEPQEIIIHEVQRHGVGVVLDLLRERICEPGEPAHVHPHREVLPLYVGRGDVRVVWPALDGGLTDAAAFGRAVAALRAARWGAVELYQLRVIDIGTKGALDRL